MIVTLILYIPVVLVAHLTPYRWARVIILAWPKMMTTSVRWLCGVNHVVEGLENLPETAAVILSKHQSTWETIAFSSNFPPHVYVVKRELLWIPIGGWGLAALRPIAINRKATRQALEQVIQQGTARLKKGLSVVIFPEGTRVAPSVRKTYSRGGAALAVSAGVPVVPVALNSGDFWPRHAFLKKAGTIRVCVGPPIETTGRSARDVTAEAEKWIEAKVEEIQG